MHSVIRLKNLTAIILPILVAACASFPYSVVKNTSGRYGQFREPISGIVGLQMTFPSSEGCAVWLQTLSRAEEGKPFRDFFACTNTSVSASLPYRSTLRNKSYGYLVDTETISLPECIRITDKVKKQHAESIEVVAPCKKK